MLRGGFADEVNQHGDDKTAIVVDLGGAYVDVDAVRYDAEQHCIVLVPDRRDLMGALWELKKGVPRACSPGA